MEVMCHAELVPDPLPYKVPLVATAAQVLEGVCELFGRDDEDMALEVDGEVMYVWGDGEHVGVGSLGLHTNSNVVLKRCRERALALVAEERDFVDVVPEWAWDDLIVVCTMVEKRGAVLEFVSATLRNDASVVTRALKKDGWALEFASDALR
eukprot:Rhum_TRINITY_DN15373_c1_g3::Rhum_TRINITY_DN15373_c1_g3_i1::g.153063::m.153063